MVPPTHFTLDLGVGRHEHRLVLDLARPALPALLLPLLLLPPLLEVVLEALDREVEPAHDVPEEFLREETDVGEAELRGDLLEVRGAALFRM